VHPAAVIAAAVALATAAPAHVSHGGPTKPFHQRHAVRAYFGDPRVESGDEADGTFPFVVDLSTHASADFRVVAAVLAVSVRGEASQSVLAGGIVRAHVCPPAC